MIHKRYSITEVKQILLAEGTLVNTEMNIRTIAYDSRKLTDLKNSLFFAIKGRADGHDFIEDVYEQGIRNFVISDSSVSQTNYKDANFLLVKDTLQALQLLSCHHRKQFEYPVIAVTGSNGKTVVKEWLYQLLAPEQNIVRSPKSYNSQIGVPLSVWEMTQEHTLAIFEAGVSRTGEMINLARVIQPSIGILTNVGEAHNEGFSDREEKIREKLVLFQDTDLFIYCTKYLRYYAGEIPGKKHFTWAWDEEADLSIIGDEVLEEKFLFLRAKYLGEDIQCVVPFIDAASVENAISCWATMLALGYLPQDADLRLEKLHPVKMRLELKDGINDCSIVDDSYSSDISSLAIALDFLKQQNQHAVRTLILSDIPETGIDADTLYTQVAQLLENKDVSRFIGVGPEISKHADKFNLETAFFNDTSDLLLKLKTLKLYNETILLKGARSFGFERISTALTKKVHETVLEINLNAIEHNLNYYKSLLDDEVKLMIMVKAFSYGSGSYEIANLLQFNNVDWLAVAYADEGVTLRNAGITLPIMVMNPDQMAFDTIIENSLEPEIYSISVLKDFIELLKLKNKTNYPIHIKLDTGMHRLGFTSADLNQLLEEIQQCQAVKIVSCFSHLVASDDAESDDFTNKQIDLFEDMTRQLETVTQYAFVRHIANTSAISRHPRAQFDMVRLGIGLYGFDSTYKSKRSPLHTVTTLKTNISQIKELQPGETVGYNRKGQMPNGGKIATIKIGYADGYNRKLGNGVGKMLLNGVQVPTIGNICMDMCMIDITGVNANEGDEVIVFNDSGHIEDIAAQLETIPYEILTCISERVKRLYYYE